MADICVVCKANNAWRIKLREAEVADEEESQAVCEHVVCIYCVLLHLENWIELMSKPRIKCPGRQCRKRIHENDIRALLDPACSDLDVFMDAGKRRQLQHMHDSAVIKHALGEENTRECPRCGNLYGRKTGCHYVRCPNLRCNTWFCWVCGKKDANWFHFRMGVSECNYNWDDILKGLYFIQFLIFAGGLTLFYYAWPIGLALFFFLPMLTIIITPVCILRRMEWEWKKKFVKQHLKKPGIGRKILLVALKVVLYILLLPAGFIAGVLVFLTSCLLFILYFLMLLFKLIPIVGQLIFMLEFFQCVTGCCGCGDWLHRYKKSKERKEEERIRDRGFRREASERLANPNVGR